MLINNGAMFVTANSAGTAFGLLDYIALNVGTAGFLIEAVADA